MAIKKYLSIYYYFCKFSLMELMAYRVSFLFEVIIDTGYTIWIIIFFQVVFGNVNQVSGWSYYEVMFLIGINLIVTYLIEGLIHINNLKYLPEKIKDGDLDLILTKPLNSLFMLSLSKPYLTSLLFTIPGFFLIHISLNNLSITTGWISLFSGAFILIGGMIIGYSILVLISSLSFIFLNTQALPKLALDLLWYSNNPHTVYAGMLRFLFMVVIPVIFMASVPTSTWIHGVNYFYLILSVIFATTFLIGTIIWWNKVIKNYASASSLSVILFFGCTISAWENIFRS